jgi:hypothetical protein
MEKLMTLSRSDFDKAVRRLTDDERSLYIMTWLKASKVKRRFVDVLKAANLGYRFYDTLLQNTESRPELIDVFWALVANCSREQRSEYIEFYQVRRGGQYDRNDLHILLSEGLTPTAEANMVIAHLKAGDPWDASYRLSPNIFGDGAIFQQYLIATVLNDVEQDDLLTVVILRGTSTEMIDLKISEFVERWSIPPDEGADLRAQVQNDRREAENWHVPLNLQHIRDLTLMEKVHDMIFALLRDPFSVDFSAEDAALVGKLYKIAPPDNFDDLVAKLRGEQELLKRICNNNVDQPTLFPITSIPLPFLVNIEGQCVSVLDIVKMDEIKGPVSREPLPAQRVEALRKHINEIASVMRAGL